MTARLETVARPRVDAAEAAMGGLGLLRREPRTWLAWAGVSLAFSLVVGVGLLALSGPAFASLAALGPRPDPAVVGAAMAGAAPGWLLSLVLSLAFYAVFYAAMNRAVLRPGEGGWFHLRLGADELRQAGLFVLMTLLMTAVYVVIVVAAVVLIAIDAGVGALTGGVLKGSASAIIVGLVAVLLLLGVLFGSVGAFIWVGVRLSLASALTFDTGRVRLFGSWRLTKGVFWPLFGAYLLAFVVMALIGLATLVLTGLVGLASGGLAGVSGAMLRPDMSSVGAYFSPARIVSTLVGATAYPAFLALLAGSPANAYAQIVRSGAALPGGRFGDARAEVFGPAA